MLHSFVAPVIILAASICIASSCFFTVGGSVVPYRIAIFQYRPYECKIDFFERTPIDFKFKGM